MGEALVEASDERDPDTPGVGLTPAPPLARFCEHLTKSACRAARGTPTACAELHFRPIRYPWTNSDVHCHFLDACKFRGTCRYVHWELDVDDGEIPSRPDPPPFVYSPSPPRAPERLRAIPDPQWIRADLKRFDLCLLGDFAVVLVDPPWNIGIDLPYDTMSDADMRNLGVEALQTEGYLFLWVTGRAMELGRTCMAQWKYRRVAELVWIKVNQMQNIIRTGRTGHFLNHSKEHMLIGVKGEPPRARRAHDRTATSSSRRCERHRANRPRCTASPNDWRPARESSSSSPDNTTSDSPDGWRLGINSTTRAWWTSRWRRAFARRIRRCDCRRDRRSSPN